MKRVPYICYSTYVYRNGYVYIQEQNMFEYWDQNIRACSSVALSRAFGDMSATVPAGFRNRTLLQRLEHRPDLTIDGGS